MTDASADTPGPLTAADFETLLEASRALAGTLDLPVLLRTVMELAARVVRAESSSLLLKDEKTNELYFDVALGTVGEKVKTVRLKSGEGLAGWVAANEIPLIVNDVQKDPRWTGRVDERSDFVTRQLVAVPLLHQGRLLGVLEGINKKGEAGFTSVDRRALEIFAAQAAVAIANARLFSDLRSEKETLGTLVSEMSDGALLLDDGGRVTLVNAAGARLLGVPEGLPGKSLEEATRSFEVCPPWKEALASTEPVPLVLTREVGKKFILEGTFQPLREGVGGLFIFQDRTEARREDRLKRNFLSVISHKLKTPLVSITGFAPLLLEDKSLSPTQRQGLTAIRDQGKKLAQLVEKLLNFATVEAESVAVTRRREQVRPLLAKAGESLASDFARQGAEVHWDEGLDGLPAVSVDPDRFIEVMRNLIENAAKFNHKLRKIIRVFGRCEGGEVVLSVEDEGSGIPPEDVPKIFKKFYQVEDSFTGQVEGVGLGLALSRRILEAHGGSLRVHSILGRGSVFTARWPLDE
ncbi:MAG: GAF domain-containing protein [Elusimicrobia bacterium]|jgi:signal transduction histidine kinase|nr:GAF domain-containing protein [Elusimicrobiota bacterium]